MKRIVSCILLAVLCCSLAFFMTSCGADQSGEWGAYYQAFRAFSGSISGEVNSVCLNYTGIEEKNQKKLYDLFVEYCEDHYKTLHTGDLGKIFEMAGVNYATNMFNKICLVTFADVTWNQDRTEATMSVSIKRNLYADGNNSGGVVKVVKKGDGWKATPLIDEEELMKTKAGAYGMILQHYLRSEVQIDCVNKHYVSLDTTDLQQDVKQDVIHLVRSEFAGQGMSYIEATWDELKEKGYVVNSEFSDGYHLTFGNERWSEDGKNATIYSWMIEGDYRALGGIFTLVNKDGKWIIDHVDEMVS